MTMHPALRELILCEDLGSRLRAAGVDVDVAQQNHLRAKDDSGIIGLDLRTKDRRLRGYLRWSAEPERALEIAAKAARLSTTETPLGAAVQRIEPGLLLFLLPNDYALRDLAKVSDPRRLARVLRKAGASDIKGSARSPFEIVTYKPERRVVGRASVPQNSDGGGEFDKPGESLFVRLSADPNAGLIASAQTAAADRGVEVPRTVGSGLDGRFHVEMAVPGVPLLQSPTASSVTAERLDDLLTRIASATPTVERHVSDEAEHHAALAMCRGLAEIHPSMEEQTVAVSRLIVSRRPHRRSTVFAHGDLHLDQFVQDGTTLWTVDWERACLGHPARDLGRLAAHAIAISVAPGAATEPNHRALVQSVVGCLARRRGSGDTSDADLAFFVASGLVDRALMIARSLTARAAECITALLSEAITLLTDGLDALDGLASTHPSQRVQRQQEPRPHLQESR